MTKTIISEDSDISEAARIQLAISETRYRRLFETAKDGILILDDKTGMIMDVNPFLIDLLGYSKEQFIEKAIWEIGFFKDIVANRDNFTELQEKEYIRYEDLPLETADGRTIHVEFVSNVYLVDKQKVIQCNIRDMTKRVAAEMAMIASETRYRRLFETAKDGILILDAESGKIVDVNPFLISLLGYSREQFIEKTIWEIGFFKDIVANQENFLELKEKEYARYEDLPLETADGRKIDVEFVSNVYLVNHQKVIQCNIRDITDRVRVERFQHLSNVILGILSGSSGLKERISNILRAIRDETKFSAVGIRLQNEDDFPYFAQYGFTEKHLLRGNHIAALTISGGTYETCDGKLVPECLCDYVLSGKTFGPGSLFTPAGSFWCNDTSTLASLAKAQYPSVKLKKLCIDDGYGSIAIIPIMIHDEIVGILQMNEKKKGAFTIDMITFFEAICSSIGTAIMRKQILEKLRSSEERYRKAQEVGHIGGWEYDVKNDQFWGSEEGKRIYGFDQVFDIFKVEEVMNCVLDKAGVNMALTELIANDKPYNIVFDIIPLHSTTIRTINSIAELSRDENGEPSKVTGVMQDITDRVHAREELIIARDHAEESDRLKSAFLANMSHEIRTPMNGILGFASLLKEPGLSGAEQKDYISIIERSGARMLNIINDIVSISKIESGQMEVSLSKASIMDQMDYIYTFFKPEAEKKGLRFIRTNSLQHNSTIIVTDHEKLYAILLNLVNNSIKFCDTEPSSSGAGRRRDILNFM
ncbi:MAG: PAS domain S-box protein [Bacteroidota bacterium]